MTRSWHSSEQRAQLARQEREAVWTPASGAEGRAAVVSTAPGQGRGWGPRWGWPRISPPGSSRLCRSHPALTSGCPGTRESRVGSVLPGCDCSEGPGHLRGRLGGGSEWGSRGGGAEGGEVSGLRELEVDVPGLEIADVLSRAGGSSVGPGTSQRKDRQTAPRQAAGGGVPAACRLCWGGVTLKVLQILGA